jgi:hypothetical protein
MRKIKNVTDIEFNHDLSHYKFQILWDDDKIESVTHFNKDELIIKRKDALRQMNKSVAMETISDLVKVENNIDPFPTKLPTDHLKIKKPTTEQRARKKAIMAINSMLNFYLTENFIQKNEYIKAKASLDKKDLAGLIMNIELMQRAINQIMETIESGEAQPRVYEVFSTMQQTYIDLLKTKSMFMLTTEEHTKKLRADYDIYKSINIDSETDIKIKNDRKFRGTHEMLIELNK